MEIVPGEDKERRGEVTREKMSFQRVVDPLSGSIFPSQQYPVGIRS